MIELFEQPFFQRALLAGVLASVACGVVGSFVVVRRMASISGGLAHAAFGGVGLAHLLGFSPTIGATGFAVLCGLGIGVAGRRLRASFDTVIAMVWALGMALGILFISLTPGYAPDLMSYLFGSILFVPEQYLLFLAALDGIILICVIAGFKELQAVAFDEEYAQVVGIPARAFQFLLLILISLAVVALIRVVGVILVIALLTIPAAVARQWSDRLSRMMIGAAMVGAVCCIGGLFLSAWLASAYGANVPTGPVIILLTAVLYGTSSLIRRRG